MKLRNCLLVVCLVLGCVPRYVEHHYDEAAVNVRIFRAEIHRLHVLARYHSILVCDEDYDVLTDACRKQELAWYIIGVASTNAEVAVDAYWHGRGTSAECIGAIVALKHTYDATQVLLMQYEDEHSRH